ncbi:MAG: anti-sigma factor family protein, partial [Methylocella sp.]
ELHGLVDGDLECGRREAVQLYLAASPEDAARVEQWRWQNETIRAAFAAADQGLLPWSLPLTPGAGGVTGTEHAGLRPAEAGFSRAWRERWFARLIGLSFASGALFALSAAYLAGGANAPDAGSPSAAAGTFVARAMSALRAFVPPSGAVRLSPNGEEPRQDPAAPILPNLLAGGLKLAGVRAMPGDQGQMLCLIYARPEAANFALCAETAGDAGESVPLVSGSFPSATITWRQKRANYALTGALPESELRALADTARTEVAAFDGR